MTNKKAFERWEDKGINMVFVGSVDGYAVGFEMSVWKEVADVMTMKHRDGSLSNTLRKFHCAKPTGKAMDVAAALNKATFRLYIGQTKTWYDFEDAVARVTRGTVGGHHYNAKLDKVVSDKGYDVVTNDGRYRIECKGIGGQFARCVYNVEEED